MSIEPWMMNYISEIDPKNKTMTFACNTCFEKLSIRIVNTWVIGNEKSYRDNEGFLKKHSWCNLDREFNIQNFERVLCRELTSKEKEFCHTCMDEGMDAIRILNLLQKLA